MGRRPVAPSSVRVTGGRPEAAVGCNWGVLVNLDDGSSVVLGEVLARAGEGTIYAVVDRAEWVAKVFHADGRGVGGKGEK